jgi:hypothetical protein
MPFQFRKQAIEEDLNSNFPSQGQGNPPLYYSLSEVVVPTYSINQSAEGSQLPESLQQAWDFSTGWNSAVSASQNIITNTGFWLVDASIILIFPAAGAITAAIRSTDGLSTKKIWEVTENQTTATISESFQWRGIIFVNTGETVSLYSSDSAARIQASYRQVAALNGDLVDPLGYSAA